MPVNKTLQNRVVTLEHMLQEQEQCVARQSAQLEATVSELRQEHERLQRRLEFLELMKTASMTANEAGSFWIAVHQTLRLLCSYLRVPAGYAWLPNGRHSLGDDWIFCLPDASRELALADLLVAHPDPDIERSLVEGHPLCDCYCKKKNGGYPEIGALLGLDIQGVIRVPVRSGPQSHCVMIFLSTDALTARPERMDELMLVANQLAHVAEREQVQLSLELTVAERTSELRSLAASLQVEVEERRKAEAWKDELVSTVSHELRTPLASLRGFSELLLHREYSRDRQQQFVGIIYREATRLTNLINEFLDIQRMEKNPQLSFVIESVDLNALLDDCAAVFAPHNNLHHLRLHIPELPRVEASVERIKQVVANLLSNAFKYSPKGGTVTLEARLEEAFAVISITDEGIGIPEEAIPKLFRRFYRVDNAETRSVGGTGLGLALAKSIVVAHGGDIEVSSRLGEGSTFSFRLPLPRTVASPPQPPKEPGMEHMASPG